MRLAMDFHSALRASERAKTEAMLKDFFYPFMEIRIAGMDLPLQPSRPVCDK